MIQEPSSMSKVHGTSSLFIVKETGSVFIIPGTKAPGTGSVYSLRNRFCVLIVQRTGFVFTVQETDLIIHSAEQEISISNPKIDNK